MIFFNRKARARDKHFFFVIHLQSSTWLNNVKMRGWWALLPVLTQLSILLAAPQPDYATFTIDTTTSIDPTKQYYTLNVYYYDALANLQTFLCDFDVSYSSITFSTTTLCSGTGGAPTTFASGILGSTNATNLCNLVTTPIGPSATALAPYACQMQTNNADIPCDIVNLANATTADDCYTVHLWESCTFFKASTLNKER